jgi:hypothetical protein
MLEIQNYKKLVGFTLQSGGFLISINDVTDREDHYHFMMELRESGEVKDYLALRLGKEKCSGVGGFPHNSWYLLAPVHNPVLKHTPMQIVYYELTKMNLFGELVCKYGRSVWEI